MADVVVLGGGVCGLATGVLLARDGHDVCLLEADPTPVPATPEEAWSRWERKGVVQFRQPHFLQPRVREVLERELPDVLDRLLAIGAARVDGLQRLPPAIEDRARRDGDERFVSVTARRPTTELVFATMADEEPKLDVRRGVEVAGLETRTRGNGVPQVCGVRTRAGEHVSASLVVDATGRSSRLPAWLRDVGVQAIHEEAEDSGFLYYTRFFRSRDGSSPEPHTPGLLTPLGSFSILTLPSDRDTWCVTLFASSGDRLLKRLKDADSWAAVVAACPLHAHWLEGEPISDVLPMAGVLDRYRRLASAGRPAATGIALVADAWACTNPSLARGLALGLAHAARLRDVVREHVGDSLGLAMAWDAVTEAEFTPWYRATVAVDRARLAEIHALRDGRKPASAADRASALRERMPRAAALDADIFRAFLEIVSCLTLPSDVLARPGVADRVLELTEAADGRGGLPGPTRAELVELLR
jgi:2-polyprenyl-6-methoxyphenol hydroxylase-like FAD-dependent oxidoreductase